MLFNISYELLIFLIWFQLKLTHVPTPVCGISHLRSAAFPSQLVLALLLPHSSISLMVTSIILSHSIKKLTCFVSGFLFSLNDEHTNYTTTSRSVAVTSKTRCQPLKLSRRGCLAGCILMQLSRWTWTDPCNVAQTMVFESNSAVSWADFQGIMKPKIITVLVRSYFILLLQIYKDGCCVLSGNLSKPQWKQPAGLVIT